MECQVEFTCILRMLEHICENAIRQRVLLLLQQRETFLAFFIGDIQCCHSLFDRPAHALHQVLYGG